MSASPTSAALSVPLPVATPVPSAVVSVAADGAPVESRGFEFASQLDLASIRSTLIRLEESIIFALIERAQFRMNDAVYAPVAAGEQSLLARFLASTESLHATVRRYTSPCEQPFSTPETLPQPILPQLEYPNTIKANTVNHNERIMKFYLGTVLPSICSAGDDSNYGSSCLCDVHALQLLSKRIHYGKFVAESKFLSERDVFTTAIKARDIAALTSLITKPSVEEAVLQRVRAKAATYGRPPSEDGAVADGTAYKVPPAVIAELYEQIMTLTKDVQIEYLLARLD